MYNIAFMNQDKVVKREKPYDWFAKLRCISFSRGMAFTGHKMKMYFCNILQVNVTFISFITLNKLMYHARL